jgi:hypothetical protein
MVFENRVLRRIFGPETDKVTEEWRRLQSEELYELYSSPNIIWVIKSRRMRWTGYVAYMKDRTAAYRVLVRRTEGKRPLGRPRHQWEDDIKTDLNWAGLLWLRIGTGGGLL